LTAVMEHAGTPSWTMSDCGAMDRPLGGPHPMAAVMEYAGTLPHLPTGPITQQRPPPPNTNKQAVVHVLLCT
jgi:hypothetical protein